MGTVEYVDCSPDMGGSGYLLQDISERTNMLPSDISDTLKQLGLLQYWKGSHYICANPKVVEDHWRAIANQRTLDVDPKYLHWQPLPPAAPPKAK